MRINLKIIIISTINIIMLNNIIGSNYLMDTFNNNSFLFPLIIGVLSILLILLVPKLSKKTYSSILKSTFIRFIISLFLFLFIITLLLFSFYIISERFFYLTPTYLIIAFTMFFIFLSLKSFYKTISNILLFSSIIIILISSFHLFNFYPYDFNLIKLDTSFISTSYKSLFMIVYTIEIIIFLFIPSSFSKVAKKDLIISIIVGSIISSLLILENYLFVSSTFYEGINFPSLYRFKLYSGPKYIEHFDNFLSLIISIFIISKTIFYLELLRIFLHIKKKISYRLISTLFMSVILTFLFYHITYSSYVLSIFSIILSSLILLIYLSLWRFKANETNRRIKTNT